ncbi:DNA translocase FtsK [Saccharococcus thermophilus]|uniref:S-DNA-T family DNA segregation ATPase FtsK/SpoIIIE n=1 Tax=Saccharococcus thermophilus TaxID=29396 RepID=A0A846MJI4_9BACL|nr:DNA translocase FtsK [Saccharococcus thermophilus]NIK15780.1 S-DNA-T family DNA segregation ATPase FtsK/SpoIIIE [Saccharococcus thermophilus]
MKWFKRFIHYWLESDDEEPSASPDRQHRHQPMPPKLDAKVVYQYPKGNFRFPLIPDDRPAERHFRSFRQEYEENNQAISSRSYVPKYDQSGRVDDKKPFRPSDVPSPIYGYNRKVTKKSDVVIEWELPSYTKDDKLSISVSEEEETGGRLAAPECLHTSEKEINSDAPRKEEGDIDLPNSSEEQHETTDGEKEELFLEAEQPKKEEENDGERAHETKQQPSQPRSRIPYNVIMLKQDRKKWEEKRQSVKNGYQFPSLSLLESPKQRHESDEQWIREQCERLNRTFASFHIGAKVVHTTQGPTVTRFEVQPDLGVKVSKITNLADDIKLNLAAKDIRIEAPIPGKRTIGIEVPNLKSRPVLIREILESEAFRNSPSPLTVALGLDISGAPIVTDLKKMPHGLIAGATGSGKSVCINTMLVSLLYKAAPHEVKLLLIDPKMVELAPYNDIPHLVSPVITDSKAATGALKWAVEEMERRYELFAHAGVRDIQKYNELVKQKGSLEHHLPYIVIIIDELADLMMVAPADVEEAICRLAQKARACGIHLVVATQRPSVDVITGLIKANIPTRIAFSVSSQVDSRTIIDVNGAEKLLGRGDMLFLENGSSKTVRLQGSFVSGEEIERVVAHVKAQMAPSYLFQQDDFVKKTAIGQEEDELFYEACHFVVQQGGASTSSLQRHFRIGYNRAARLIEMMEQQGIISEARGSKPREVLITEEELANWQENSMI